MTQRSAAVELLEKRRHTRTPISGPVRMSSRTGWVQRTVKGDVQDVSPTGMRMLTLADANPQVGDPIAVQWIVPETLSKVRAGTSCRLRGEIVRVAQEAGSDGGMELAIRFNGLISEQLAAQEDQWHRVRVGALLAVLGLLILSLKTRNVVSFWYDPWIQIYSIGAAVYVVTRVLLSMFYREPEDRGLFKKVSVIIAVKNELDIIAKTIRLCLESHYPKYLMDVMVIDDGSTDGTWDELMRLKSVYPQLRIFQFEKNKGKRHAMALGAEEATGDILIYLDSDSFLDPEGIYRIVQPFDDSTVGAVAGHTLMIEEPNNFISKMESVRYFVSQRVMKAAESLFGAVTCCPGPFSAYRREAVLGVLGPWLNQRFMGTPATFGDDRSLTNHILPYYRVLYHAGAQVSTFAPSTWSGFVRQQLRWKKSWIRETTIAIRHMYKEHPIFALAYYFSVVITLVSPLIVLRAFFYSPIVLQSHAYFPYIAGLLLVFLFLGLVHYYYTRSRYWYYGLAFAVCYCVFFCLQNYYAVLTVRQNHWGTR